MDTKVEGDPIDILTVGFTIAETNYYSVNYNINVDPESVRDWLGSDVSDSTVKAVSKFINADDPERLAKAVRLLDIPREDVGEAMEVADQHIHVLDNKDKRPTDFSHKYIPSVIKNAEGGTIYMCKSINANKAMMAWDLNPNNVVVKVDNYKDLEVLGWEKLKDFPHGERQIREQYGDELSDDVLLALCGDDSSGNSNGSGKSQTAPSSEQLTISAGPEHHRRFKLVADEVREQFKDKGQLEKLSVSKLVLFPTGTEHNLSDNWWIAGSYKDDESVGIANCNKSTYEYLSDLDNVLHVDNYINRAGDETVVTTDGKKKLSELDDDYIVYTLSDEAYERFVQPVVLENLRDLLRDTCESSWRTPDIDNQVIVLLPQYKTFETRPILKDAPMVLFGDQHHNHHRDIGPKYAPRNENVAKAAATMQMYAKVRLGNWDWDSPEMSAIQEGMSVGVDEGGYELVETLAELHDAGKPLYSETPKGRWSQ